MYAHNDGKTAAFQDDTGRYVHLGKENEAAVFATVDSLTVLLAQKRSIAGQTVRLLFRII